MQALAELPIIAGVLVCLGLAAIVVFLIVAILAGVIKLLNLIPGVNIGTAFVNSTNQAVWNALGRAIAQTDAFLGWQFHNLARLAEWTWREFKSHAVLIASLATPFGLLVSAFQALRSLVHSTAHNVTNVQPRIKALEKEYRGIEHELHTLEREISKGIGADVLPRIRSLDREVGRIEHSEIPAIRAAEGASTSAISDLWSWVHANVVPIATTAFAGAVAVALGKLGLGGLRCNTLLNSLKTRGCGLWGGLEDLLGLFVDTLLLTNVCELVPVLETAVSDVADPLVIGLTDIGAGLCSGGIGAPPALHTPALSLPANPGFTLSIA